MQPNVLPDYHFLYIPPSLGVEWLFDAARRYWERFMPTVISDFEFVGLIPEDISVSVTVITRRDQVAQLGVELARVRPNTYFDAVVHDSLQQMQAALDARAERNQPFGVPLAATLTPDGLVQVTPGALLGETGEPVPTRVPGGFVTQTPTPTSPPTLTPQPPDTTPQGPLRPTPGAIIGS
jgi:hypothetical protein